MNSLKVVVFLTKSNTRFKLMEVRRNLHQEIISPPENEKPVGQRDLLASMTMDQDFPGKITHCRHPFFHCYLVRSVER